MYGAVILMFSTVLVKLIGAFFKIPLTNIIGSEGMAYFNAAYSIYTTFYMVSTAGLPVAISRMIATSNARGNVKEVNKVFKIAYWLFFTVGLFGTAIMIALRDVLVSEELQDASIAIIAIAPTLFFICISSAYRGYFQGLQNMTPTAVSQVIESLGKLLIGLVAGWYFTSLGYPIHIVAAFVILGVTIGVVASTMYAFFIKRMYSVSEATEPEFELAVRPTKSLLAELVAISIPITLASSIMGFTNIIDTWFVTSRMTASGAFSDAYAVSAYGSYTSQALTLFNMPTNLISPFAISALPALSRFFGAKQEEEAKSLLDSTFRVASIVAFPCALGLSAMAGPILQILFSTEYIEGTTKTTSQVAAPCLAVMGLAVFFLGLIGVTNSALQAYNLQNKTIISTVSGIAVKLILSYVLIGIPEINVVGAAISTAACYFTIMILNMYFMTKHMGYLPKIRSTFLKPFISSVVCIVPCVALYSLLNNRINSKIGTLLSICVAGVVYILMLLSTKALAEQDIKMLPKSEKIIKILRKANLLS